MSNVVSEEEFEVLCRLVDKEVYTICGYLVGQLGRSIVPESHHDNFEEVDSPPDYAYSERDEAKADLDEQMEEWESALDDLEAYASEATRTEDEEIAVEASIEELRNTMSEAEDAYNDGWSDERIREQYREPFQYWIVSDYFAERATEAGLRVTNVLDLNVWTRFECGGMSEDRETGQYCDEVARIAVLIHARVKALCS